MRNGNDNNRTLLVKVTDATLAKVHAMAEARDLTITEYVRGLIDDQFEAQTTALQQALEGVCQKAASLNKALKRAGVA